MAGVSKSWACWSRDVVSAPSGPNGVFALPRGTSWRGRGGISPGLTRGCPSSPEPSLTLGDAPGTELSLTQTRWNASLRVCVGSSSLGGSKVALCAMVALIWSTAARP